MVKGRKNSKKENLDLKSQGSFPKYLQCKIQVDRERTLQKKRDFDIFKIFF